jgi:hypothetical protein
MPRLLRLIYGVGVVLELGETVGSTPPVTTASASRSDFIASISRPYVAQSERFNASWAVL